MEHVTSARTIIKIGCPDLNIVESLSDQINEAVRQLPVTRQQGVAYRMNEVFIDIKDHSDILMNCDGAVLERKSLNRVYVQAFVSGSPECRLVLNDVEALLLLGKGELTNSVVRQVKLSDVVLHPCVDKSLYKRTRELKFNPVDGYPFELLRCSIEPYISPPINVSTLMEYDEQKNAVRITASFTVRKKLNVRLTPIKDLQIKFPIPSSWSSLFLADTRFGGKKSVRSTTALRGSFRRKIKSTACQIQTYLGSAKYEPEHGAIVWRVGNYTRTQVPQTLRCDVQLKPGEEGEGRGGGGGKGRGEREGKEGERGGREGWGRKRARKEEEGERERKNKQGRQKEFMYCIVLHKNYSSSDFIVKPSPTHTPTH